MCLIALSAALKRFSIWSEDDGDVLLLCDSFLNRRKKDVREEEKHGR